MGEMREMPGGMRGMGELGGIMGIEDREIGRRYKSELLEVTDR
jgi:hypothetical protein